MGKKTKTGKGRLDKYYHLAKEQGYRSRAAFKLVQLNKKYDFLNDAKVVLDLCAAPGGWLQVSAKYMPMSSLLIGIDLVPIAPIKGAITFQADITTPKCRKEIQKLIKTWKADVVLHDGAPNMGKSWAFDAYTQSDLVLQSLKLATEFLRPGGTFVSKVFRSKDYNALIWIFKQLFRTVEATKPASSRNVSAEIFVVCLGYKAPDKIDPRMLDAKTVFSEVELKKKVDIFDTKQRRHREGYADDADGLLYKESSAVAFIDSIEPQTVLAEANKLTFDDEEAKLLLRHPDTAAEVALLCQDLRVLGKKEFRTLLKWRERMRAWRAKLAGTEPAAAAAAGAEPAIDGLAAAAGSTASVVTTEPIELSPEEQLARELDYFKEKSRLREKRARRHQREELSRYRARLALNMVNPNDVFETPTEQGLFELKQIRGGDAALARLLSSDDPSQVLERSGAALGQGEDADVYIPLGDGGSSDEDDGQGGTVRKMADTDDFDAVVEAALDRNYEEYLSRRKSARRRVRVGKRVKRASEFLEVDMDLYASIKAQEANPDGVVIRPNLSEPMEALAGVESGDDDDASSADETRHGARRARAGAADDSGSDDDDDDDDDDDGDDDDDSEETSAHRARRLAANSARAKNDGAPLLVDFKVKRTAEEEANERAAMWFSQDVFAGLGADEAPELEVARMVTSQSARRAAAAAVAAGAAGVAGAEPTSLAGAKRKRAAASGEDSAASTTDNAASGGKRRRTLAQGEADSADAAHEPTSGSRAAATAARQARGKRGAVTIVALDEPSSSENPDSESDSRSCRSNGSRDGGGSGSASSSSSYGRRGKRGDDDGSDGDFEVVPKQEEFEDEDDRAQYLALAQQYAKNRRINDLADKSYNRWAFNDRDSLPEWFAVEEDRYNKPEMPVTKEQMAEIKSLYAELNARPIKKVLEARMRKKKKAVARQDMLRRKLTALSNDEDIDERSKARAMERAVKIGARGEKKPEKTYIVGKKTGGRGSKSKSGRLYKMVDKRMLKDRRATKAKERRESKSSRKGSRK